ncbi:MAG: flagellin, partial [Pseudomonadota bacterium]
GQPKQLLTLAVGAEKGFSLFVQSLNTQNGGRSPFAGTATNAIALLPGERIIDDLEVLVTGAPDAATMITLVDDYFTGPAGGYETVAYQGNAAAQTGFTIDDGEVATTDITALDPAIRRTLSGLAMASLLARSAGPVDDASREAIADQAGEWMQEGFDATTDLRARLGVVEARVDAALTRHRATLTTLGSERAEMVNADPFEAAIELQAVETRLETIFLMTARLQRLTLAEYL